ncbi:MAG: putative manganese transporter [Bacteroidales bacterium]|nr:putative manganese transporter [Bacteroidales bacterium]
MNIAIEALKNSILITGLVMIMMLLIEYINIHSHGNSFRKLKKSPIKQVIVAASLGLIPGCIGGFAVVSLYTHKLLSFGALVAMMIASSGDEAFIMLAMIPKTAIILFVILFILGIAAGIITDRFVKREDAPFNPDHYETHDDCCGNSAKKPGIFSGSIIGNMKNISRQRFFIMAGIFVFIVAVVAGILEHDHAADHGHEHAAVTTSIQLPDAHIHDKSCILDEHDHPVISSSTDHDHGAHFNIFSERWINLIFAGISLLTLFLTARASEHFIKEHLWNHVVKKHLKSIFLWTFGALLVIHFGMRFLHIEEWIAQNVYIMILLAVAIGLIPESGPHMVFITLFAGGFIPFSVLLASSIVQDGHTALPLLAESKRSFFKAKLINMAIGLAAGVLLHLAGL